MICNGLTRYGIHDVCLYTYWVHAEETNEERVHIDLLGTSPMPAMEKDDKLSSDNVKIICVNNFNSKQPHLKIGFVYCSILQEDEDAQYLARFDAKHDLNHFDIMLEQYNPTIVSLFLALVGNNTEVNRRTADAGLPHLPYLNHTYALMTSESLENLVPILQTITLPCMEQWRR